MRDAIESCTGDGGMDVEDERDYCLGWKPIKKGVPDPNCTRMAEFE